MHVPAPPAPDPPPARSAANRLYLPGISRETIIDLVADMNRVGFGVLSGYLELADLEEFRRFVETAVAAAGGEYVAFAGEDTVASPLLEKLSTSPNFVNLLHQVYEQGSGRPAPNQSVYQVLRCLKGKSGLKHAFYFSLRLLCRDRSSAGNHSIPGEPWSPCHGTQPAPGQIGLFFQSPRQDNSG